MEEADRLWTRRRSIGEGTVRQRPDGRWEARVTIGYEAGRQVRRSFYGRTRAEVATQMTEALKNLAVGQAPTNERETVGEYLTGPRRGVPRRRSPTRDQALRDRPAAGGTGAAALARP